VVLEDEPMMLTRDLSRAIERGWERWVERAFARPAGLPLIPIVCASFALLPLDLCLRLIDQGSSWRGVAWMSIFATLLSLLLWTAPWGWDRITKLAGPIDRMLDVEGDRPGPDGSSIDASSYVRHLSERLPLRKSHYLLCLADALASLAGTYFVSRQLPPGTFGPVFYVYAALLGVVVFDSLRSMVRLPLIILRPLTRFRRLTVVMHSPATTPAVRDMARLAADTAAKASFALLIIGLWLLWELFSGRPGGGPGLSHVQRLMLVDIPILIVSTVLVVYVTFVPQYWLSEVVRRQRDRILDELGAELPTRAPARLVDDHAQKIMKLYDSIAGVTTGTSEIRVLVRRTIAVVAVLTPQLVAVGVKLLHLG
jgi:hypothetical protein